jgi:hypothetical protein
MEAEGRAGRKNEDAPPGATVEASKVHPSHPRARLMSSVDSFAPDVEAPRSRRVRVPRKSVDQPPRRLDRPTAKSADPELDKLSVYVPIQVLKKLTVASALWDKDKSDIVAEVLSEKLSGVTYYDRNATRPSAEALPFSGIGSDSAGD